MVKMAVLLKVAFAFWSGTPGYQPGVCPEGLKYRVVPAYQMLASDTIAQAVLNSCVITFRQGWRKMDNGARYLGDEWACHVVIHEAGHAMMGLEHSDDPHNVMNGYDDADTPGICRPYRGRWWTQQANGYTGG